MARKRRTKEDQAVGVGMTAKQRRRKKPINADERDRTIDRQSGEPVSLL